MHNRNTSVFLAALIMFCLLASCAAKPTVWSKPGSTNEEYEMAMGQCDAQAYSVPNSSLMQKNQVRDACMRGKGWKEAVN